MPYPCVIQDFDHDSVKVKAMHKIGTNRFFWRLVKDVIWYNYVHVLMFIPEPEHVTNRQMQINLDMWSKIIKALDL
jgi:hypothetical protein